MICEQKGNILSTNFEPKTKKERCTKNGDVAHVKKPAWLDMYNDSMGESIALTSFIFLHRLSTLQKVVQVFLLVHFLAFYC